MSKKTKEVRKAAKKAKKAPALLFCLRWLINVRKHWLGERLVKAWQQLAEAIT